MSARSGVTNDLIARAKALSKLPDEREMDVLMAVGEQETIALTAMALHGLGVDAVSYTGAQAGIVTSGASAGLTLATAACLARLIAGVDWAGTATTAPQPSHTAARISLTTPEPSLNATSR